MAQNWLRETLSARSGQLSSKRIFGGLGFLICMFELIYCTYIHQEAPMMIDAFMLSCMGLLGVDSVTSIWKNDNKRREENYE